MPQAWALRACGSVTLSPPWLLLVFLPGGPFRLVSGLQVGRPLGVSLPWGVLAVALSWPLGTQAPLAARALNTINLYLM